VTRPGPRLLTVAAIVAFLAAALGYPVALAVGGAFTADDGTPTLAHLRAVLADPVALRGLGNSFLIAAATTAGTLLLGVPLALLGARCDFPGRRALSALLLVPLVLPPFVGAIGMRHVLGREGALNAALGLHVDWLGQGGLAAIVLLETLSLFPIVYLNAAAAAAAIDPSLEDAARASGAGSAGRWRRVTLPLLRPGVFAGASIVAIWSFTELGTPLMFDFYDVASVQVLDGLREVESSRRPYALVAVMLACSGLLYAAGRLAVGRTAPPGGARPAGAAGRARLRGWRAAAASGAFLAVGALAAVPAAAVVASSVAVPGQWYGSVLPGSATASHYLQALSHPVAAGSIVNSLVLASAAVAIAVIVGFASARITVRSGLRAAWLVDALVMLPLAVPGLVLAFGYVAVSLRWPFGGADAPLAPFAGILGADPNPFPFLVAAYAVRRLPYVARSAAAGLEQASPELEDAARACGASRWRSMRRVAVPLVAANLAAGAVLAFSFSMLEVSDSLMLAQREAHYPVTKAIWALVERLGDGPGIASALGVWAMALLGSAVLLAGALGGRRVAAAFR
jgi:iron(III) transport system permease protein